jgi:hypothetical protein
MQGIEKFQQPVQCGLNKRGGVLMVMVPGANLGFGDDHQVEIQSQQIRILHQEIQTEIQRTETENQGNRQAVLAMLERFKSFLYYHLLAFSY